MRYRSFVFAHCCAAVLAIAPWSARAQMPTLDSLRRMAPRLSYVFDGTVTARRVSDVPNAPASPNLMTVRVNRALQCPHGVGDYTGEQLTVLGVDSLSPPIGSRNWFLASGWITGAGLAVAEVTHVPLTTTDTGAAFVRQYATALQLNADSAFADEAAAARAIVTGVVISTRGIGGGGGQRVQRQSQGEITWLHADIVATRVFRGDSIPQGALVSVLFPSKAGSPLMSVPTVTLGETALFLLKWLASDSALAKRDRTANYYLPDSLAVRPLQDTTRVRAVLRAGAGTGLGTLSKPCAR
jgi:hypothetical protein